MKTAASRLAALFLIAVITLCSAACEKESVVGTWTGGVEWKEKLNAAFREAGLNVAVDSFCLPIRLTFTADGFYEKEADAATVTELLIATRARLREELDRELDGKASDLGLSREDYLALAELDPDALAASLLDEDAVLAAAAALGGRGRYVYRDCKLYLSAAPDLAVDESTYEICDLSGDTLTLTGRVPAPPDESFFPLRFTRLPEP